MQDILALSIVFLAAAYVGARGWKFVRARRAAAGCGGACGGCAANKEPPAATQLLETIEPLRESSKRGDPGGRGARPRG